MIEAGKYDQLIIYYFSGTGNSKKCAEWIAETARKQSLKVHLINIDRFESIEIPELEESPLLGFCAPTHGFNMPPIMLKFISQFPKLNGLDCFILNTRAGMKLNKLFLPGLSGIAQFLPALMLRLKGFRIVGMQPVDLPSNWLLIHPGIRKKVVLSMVNRYQRIVGDFATRILTGKKKYQALWSLPIDIAIAPVAAGYYFVGRFFLAKTLIASEKCNSCELCVKNCPVKAIKWVDKRPFWTFKCESCMRCVNQCPERAIETAHSFSAFVVYISTILSTFLFNKYFLKNNILWVADSNWWMETLSFLVASVIMIIIVFGCYRSLHYFMQYKFFNRIITYTSLSKISWWRRYHLGKILRGK